MTIQRIARASAAGAVLLAVGAVGSAQAAVIGAAPGTSFADAPITISFGDMDQASYTFSQYLFNQAAGAAGGLTTGIATAGTAQVSSSPVDPTVADAYAPGITLSGAQDFGGPYVAFPEAAETLVSGQFPFLALSFTLADGVHYGYAAANGLTLASYAYESTPNTAIDTGATVTGPTGPGPAAPVPAPSSWGLFGLGLVLLGAGCTARRRLG